MHTCRFELLFKRKSSSLQFGREWMIHSAIYSLDWADQMEKGLTGCQWNGRLLSWMHPTWTFPYLARSCGSFDWRLKKAESAAFLIHRLQVELPGFTTCLLPQALMLVTMLTTNLSRSLLSSKVWWQKAHWGSGGGGAYMAKEWQRRRACCAEVSLSLSLFNCTSCPR